MSSTIIQFTDLVKAVKKAMKSRMPMNFDIDRSPQEVKGVRAVKNFSGCKIEEIKKDKDLREDFMRAISECDMTARDIKSMLTLAVSLNALTPGSYTVQFQ